MNARRVLLALSSYRVRASHAALLALVVLAGLAAPAAGQRQFDELRKRGLPDHADSTSAVALGDCDGDGDLDVVFGAYPRDRLYLNDGAGTYIDATAARLPGSFAGITNALAFGDVDGDGDLDLVIGTGAQNRLYLNDGSGTYTDVTAARLPADSDPTAAVALGDVDGDGDLDVALGNGALSIWSAGAQNRLYLNDGTGTFTDATVARMPVSSEDTQAVALCDVDGDGDLDMVVGNGQLLRGQQNRLYLNDGSGTFTDVTASRMPADNETTRSLALGDIDGDGDSDIVLGNGVLYRSERNRLYLNDGTGTYTDATAIRMPSAVDPTAAVTLGDVDVDGDLDILFANTRQQNRLYLNDGSGTYADGSAGRLPSGTDDTSALALGDVDGDGDLDLALANQDLEQDRLYLNDGAGAYIDATAAHLALQSDYTFAVALADVDNDADLDIVLGNQWQDRLYLNDGSGSFVDATSGRMPPDLTYTRALAVGDVDGDGDLDIVLANRPDPTSGLNGQNRLYLNDGFGAYADSTSTRLPLDRDFTSSVVLGDVDGDGDLDIVFGNDLDSGTGLAGQNRLCLNDGSGHYTDATAAHMPMDSDSTSGVALGDVDGDGDLDIVTANHHNPGERNRLYLNDGSGHFTDATAARLPGIAEWTNAVALGDVDGDGDLDIVFANDPRDLLHLNDGSGHFTDGTAARMPPSRGLTTLAVALGDVDGDGDLDLVLATGDNGLYLNGGSGYFSDATANRLPVRRPALTADTWAVALGDVDGDADLDVLYGDYGQNRLYLNLIRQIDTPLVVRVGGSYTIDAYARYGPLSLFDVALPVLSTGTARIPVPPLGVFGLDLSRAIALPAFLLERPAGAGSIDLAVPNDPAVVGVSLHAQALLVPYPWLGRLTNVTGDVVIR